MNQNQREGTSPSPDSLECARLTDSAWNVRSSEYTGLHNRDEFNAAALHVCELILSSWELLRLGRHAPAMFLTITAFEEIAKIKAGHARSWGHAVSDVKRSKDPLFSHTTKHKIALDPVLLIGSRLENTIGKSAVESIFARYADGSLSVIRERSLYFSRDNNCLRLPSTEISLRDTIEHLLIAIEMFDDYFNYLTAEASAACVQLNELFPMLAERYKAT